MPDVGVLQLTIRDNSNEAGSGLNALAGALGRVREAVSGGLKLGGVANEVTKLAKTIQEAKGTSTIVKNLGTMFNAINKFSQLKDFSIDAEKLRDTALYMNKVADGLDRVNESRHASVAGGGAHDLYGQLEEDARTVKDVLEQTADSVEKSSRRIFNIQLFGGKSGTRSGQIASDIKETVGASSDAIEAAKKVGEANDAMQQMRENMITTSSEIQHRIDTVTEKAVEMPQRMAESIGNTTVIVNESGKAVAGMISIYDKLEGHYKDIRVDTREVINLFNTPASGKNGVFANAAEEAAYLMEKVEEAKASQQQWISINEAASKQLKYGGPRSKDDLAFDLKHSEEGYYAAIEAEEQYKNGLSDLLVYAKEYVETSKNMASVTGEVASATKEQSSAIQQAANATSQANNEMQRVQSSVQTGTPEPVVQTEQRTPWTAEDVSNLVNYYTQIEMLEMKYNEMLGSLAADIEANKLDRQQIAEKVITLQNLRDKIDALKEAEESASGASKSFRESLDELFRTSKKGTFAKLLSQFARMAKMRAIRYIIREIAAGFREGIQNVYEYSKAIGSSFAPSMDGAASSLKQMKNAIGAAVAPAIQAMIPVLQNVVNWFINLVNYVNQFFALLNGQKTWTRALPQTTTAFNKQEKAAKGAAAAIKDLLADWDELNIIQSETSGGGVGGTNNAEDYLTMFEEVDKYNDKVKDAVKWIKDNFDTIKEVALSIGAALLAWKVADAIYNVLKLVGTLKGGVIMSVVGFTLSSLAGAGIAREGFTPENILKAIGGVAAAAFGGYWTASALGISGAMGAIAGVAIALAFMINSFNVEVVKNAYGDIEEDAETIRQNVLKYFNPNVEAEVNLYHARLTDTGAAEGRVRDALAVLEHDYYVAVTVKTKESLDQLKLDVDSLVLETKSLILQRKKNVQGLVAESGQFDDAESFIKFSDDQWDKTAEYVEKLGKDIGKLISDGITEGAELDGLQQRLSNIVRAVLNGQKAGEYAGKLSMASATLRNNGYTKDTVAAYIKTYNEERQAKFDEATAAAVQEKADLGALYESIRERYIQGDPTATIEDVFKAKINYESYDVYARAEQLFTEWIGEGDKLFAEDIALALQKVVEKTKDNPNQSLGFTAILNNSKNSGWDADTYIDTLQSALLGQVVNATGQSANDLKKLFSTTGIDALDVLGPEFANKFRFNVAEMVRNSNYSSEDKKKILEAFGIDDTVYDEYANQTRQKIKDAMEEAMNTPGADDVTVGAEIGELYGKYGEEYVNAVLAEMGIEFPTISELMGIPEESTTVPAPNMDDFNAEIDNSRNHVLDWLEAYYMLTGIRGDTSAVHDKVESRVHSKPVRMYASGGVVKSGDLVMANENGNFEMMGRMGNQPVVANNQQIVAGITSGVSQANEGVESRLTVIEGLLTRILSKEFVAKAVPSASWGNFNNRSNNEYGKVTGV